MVDPPPPWWSGQSSPLATPSAAYGEYAAGGLELFELLDPLDPVLDPLPVDPVQTLLDDLLPAPQPNPSSTPLLPLPLPEVTLPPLLPSPSQTTCLLPLLGCG